MRLLEKYFHVLTGLLIFLVYLFTVAPSVVQIDTGELATVQLIAGIAHPTGYPLFTILGYLFSMIPLPMTKILQLNVLTAIWCSAAVGVFVYTCRVILENLSSFQSSKKAKVATRKTERKTEKIKSAHSEHLKEAAVLPKYLIYISSVGAGLIIAFNRTYWFQATSVEVYSLHIFILSIIILSLIKSYLRNDEVKKLKYSWLVFTVFLALGFSNHMTTLLIIPATAFLYFNKYGFKKEIIKGIGIMLLLFFAILLLMYSYLPLRAAAAPLLNWGNPIDWEHIMRHISGKQYQVWLFSSTDAAKKQLEYFFTSLPLEFGFTLLIVAAGIIASIIKARKIFYFFGACFLFTVLYSINYDINDIDSYFLLAYISLGFFAMFGIIEIIKLSKNIKAAYSISFVIAAVVAFQIYSSYEEINQSGNYAFEDYTKAVLNGTLPNSLILSYQWDYFISESYYFRYIENFRRDVAVIDKELLRRSWYYNQINSSYPVVLKGINAEVNAFTNALRPFERSENFDAALLENLYKAVMTKLVSENFGRMNVYIAPELVESEMQKGEFVLPQGLTIIPDNLLFRVVKDDGQYYPARDQQIKIRIPSVRNKYLDQIEVITSTMLLRRAIYEAKSDKPDKAKTIIDKIMREYPNTQIPPELQSL